LLGCTCPRLSTARIRSQIRQCSFSGKDKDSEFTWKDADLTEAAKPQVALAVSFWNSADGKALPPASKFWSSPSQRAVKTGDQIFSKIAGFDTLIVSDVSLEARLARL
jgi:hypothetical protein